MCTKHRVFVQNFHAMSILEEIPQTARFYHRPECESSGLEVEAILDFQDKNVFSQCSDIHKQGIFLQDNYRGLV